MATQMVRGKGEEISSFDRMSGVLQKEEKIHRERRKRGENEREMR